MEYSYFKSLFNKFDKLLLMARVRPCLWVTSKTARPSLPAPTIPTQRTSTSLTTLTVQTIAEVPRSEDEYRQRISTLCANFKESEWALEIRAEIKSIDNQMAMAENVK